MAKEERWVKPDRFDSPLNMNAFHLALLLLQREKPELMKKIPLMFKEKEFAQVYSKFCKRFKQIEPNCPRSGYFGLYDDLYPNRVVEPRTPGEMKKLRSENTSWTLKRARAKDVIFIFNNDFSEFTVKMGCANQDRSCLISGRMVGDLKPREGDSIYYTWVTFYGLSCWVNYMSDICDFEIASSLLRAIKFAFDFTSCD